MLVLPHLHEMLGKLQQPATQRHLGEKRAIGAMEAAMQQGARHGLRRTMAKISMQEWESSTMAANRCAGSAPLARSRHAVVEGEYLAVLSI